VSQLSFFGADTVPPALADLAGLLAAQGTMTVVDDGAVLSVQVDAQWRAAAIGRLIDAAGVECDIIAGDDGFLVRTVPGESLLTLVRQWFHDSTKKVPDGWVPGSRAQRAWFLASGRKEVDGAQYVLGLDVLSPSTHAPLAQALMRAGIAPTLIGTHYGNPGLRISGRRRLTRLVENIGAPPDADDARDTWPHAGPDDHHM